MNADKIYAEAIANEYAPKEASKVLALKKLDMKAKSKANIFAYTFGVVMALVLGTGMCLSMGVIGGGSIPAVGAGIAVGIIGIVESESIIRSTGNCLTRAKGNTRLR